MKCFFVFNRKKILGFLVGLLLLPCFAANPNTSNVPMKELLTQFTTYASQARTDWQIPGMAIAVVNDHKIVYAEGFGQRNAQGAPVTPDTVFDIASLTKSFTATLLAIQIDEGKYYWNTKVTTLYPDFKLYDPNVTREFEVRDIVAHDSGLPESSGDALGNFGYGIDHNLYALRFIKPIAPFRAEFAYQDTLVLLAKKIIEKYSGETYTENIHQRLFTPLDMNNSYVITEERLWQLKNVAWPFVDYKNKVYPYSKDYPYLSAKWALENGVGSGGVESSVVDIAKWLRFNMNNGIVGSTQLISAKNMKFIHSPQTIIAGSHGVVEQAYGEGWFIDKKEYNAYTVLYHGGGGLGMHAQMAYIPELKIGIVILTNTWGNKLPEALSRRFFDLYLGKVPLKNWSQEYLRDRDQAISQEQSSAKPEHCNSAKPSDLDRYVGAYYNPLYDDLIISKQKDRLLLTIGPQHIIWILTPCQRNIFTAYWPNPGKMSFPMIPSEQSSVIFTTGLNHVINKMTIPFINDDGSGVFVKK